jgi:NADPH:quinone reductase-like Zn-dependent oxidoreductase
LVRSLGADVVVDYRDPVAAAKQIREAAPNLEYAVDCVAVGTSPQIVAASLGGKGTLAHISLLPYPPVEGVRILSSVVFDYIGKVRFHQPNKYKDYLHRRFAQCAPFSTCF